MSGGAVGYVVGRYPQLSQTFVSNEVRELRRQGVDVPVLSLLPGNDGIGDDGVTVLADVADDRTARLADLHLRVRRPRRYRRFRETVARLADEMGTASSQADWRRLPAAALRLEAMGVRALHAHFAWNAAAAAWALSDLLDVPWSMTLHANDIFSRRRNLEAKLAAADRLVTVCDYNLRYLRDELALDRPVELVVCGVDVPPFVEATAKDVDVVAVGRLVEKKGFDTLVDAAAELRSSRPGLTVEIIGGGPLEPALRERVAAHGLEGTVALRGGLDHQRTLARIAAARVFTLPCRVAADGDRDSMPVVIKEAMARGVPVVATNAVAVPEMVDDACGRLVPPDEPVQLAKALDELLADPDLASGLGAAGRRRVEDRFTLTGEVGKLRRMFEDVTR